MITKTAYPSETYYERHKIAKTTAEIEGSINIPVKNTVIEIENCEFVAIFKGKVDFSKLEFEKL